MYWIFLQPSCYAHVKIYRVLDVLRAQARSIGSLTARLFQQHSFSLSKGHDCMLYCHKTIYFIFTLCTAPLSVMVASDGDSEPTPTHAITKHANSLNSRHHRNYALHPWPKKKAQRQDGRHTFSKEEIEESWHRTMTCLADTRKIYGSNEEYLRRINQEQSKYIAAYHEVARYRTFSPTRLTRLEESASYLPIYFETEPLVHAEQNQHYQVSVDRYSALDSRPLERTLKKNNNCGSDEAESSDIFSALTSTLPIEQNA